MAQTNTPILLLPLAALLAIVFAIAFSFHQNSVSLSRETSKPTPAGIPHKETKRSTREVTDLWPDKQNANCLLSVLWHCRLPLTLSGPKTMCEPNTASLSTIPDPIESRFLGVQFPNVIALLFSFLTPGAAERG